MLDIRLLGPPLVYLDDEPISIQRRAPRALLFYLAACGEPLARSSLRELFWPDKSEEEQRSRLRYTLTRLRNALRRPDFIQSHLGTISLDFKRVSVDVLEFRKLLDSTSQLTWIWPANKPLPVHIYHFLTQAAALWRSPDFIQGTDMSISSALEQWHLDASRSLQEDRLHLLKRLIGHERAVGALERRSNGCASRLPSTTWMSSFTIRCCFPCWRRDNAGKRGSTTSR